jgi:hypothetical protein
MIKYNFNVQLNERLIPTSQKLMLVERYLIWSSSSTTVTVQCVKLINFKRNVKSSAAQTRSIIQDLMTTALSEVSNNKHLINEMY